MSLHHQLLLAEWPMPGIAISRREGDDRSSAGADQGVRHHLFAPFDVAKIPSRIDENIYRVASASTGSVVCRGSHDGRRA